MYSTAVSKRFWAKVDRTYPDQCWNWQGSRHKDGRGLFNVNGRAEVAPRVAWRLTHGEIPDGLSVCHKCDNPPCVNPRHLELGTHSKNHTDKYKRNSKARAKHVLRSRKRMIQFNRERAGEKSPMARLTQDEATQIRELRANGASLAQLAERFGVSMTAISRCARGKTYTDPGSK